MARNRCSEDGCEVCGSVALVFESVVVQLALLVKTFDNLDVSGAPDPTAARMHAPKPAAETDVQAARPEPSHI